MLRGAWLMAAVGLWLAQGQGCPDCPDPSRPWMRGGTEIMCAVPLQVDAAREAFPGRNVVDCHCRHTCDITGDQSQETDGRGWDPQCAARCSPKGCLCPHPCEQETQ